MKYLALPALVLLISCGSSEKNLSESTADSLAVDSTSVQSSSLTTPLTTDQLKHYTPDSLYKILEQQQLVSGAFRSGTILTNSFLRIGSLDEPSNLMAVYLESESGESEMITNSAGDQVYNVSVYLAVFEMTQPPRLVAQLEVGQYSSADQKLSVSPSVVTLSQEQAAVAILTSYKSEFDVISQKAYDRIVYYALDGKKIVQIFDYSAMEYTYQGADGWISTTTKTELEKGAFAKGTLCTLQLTSTSVDESSDSEYTEEVESSEGDESGGEAESGEPTEDTEPQVKKYKFNGKKYVAE